VLGAIPGGAFIRLTHVTHLKILEFSNIILSYRLTLEMNSIGIFHCQSAWDILDDGGNPLGSSSSFLFIMMEGVL